MADDFNYWNGINGYYPQAKTPNIDALARKGILFNNAHSASPVCNPSRNAMWSGISPMVFQYVGTQYIQIGKKWRFIEREEESELYDIKKDPYEHNNLYGNPEYKDIMSKLRKSMADYILQDMARFN